MNLWNETMSCLEKHNKTTKDVKFVVCGNSECSILWFAEMSKKINYDNGFGTQHINPDLKIVGNSWWLERNECGGLEGWEFKALPSYSQKFKILIMEDVLQ